MVVSNEQFQKVTSNMMTGFQELSQLSNESMNAAMQSASIITKGYEEIFANIANLVKTSFENSMAASKAMMTCSSPQDAWTVQTNAIKSNTDFITSEVTKISEMSSRLAQEAMSPLASQMNSTISTVTKMSRAA